MGIVRFARDKQDNYFIINSTDEELRVVAELLLNKQAREVAKQMIFELEPGLKKSGNFTFVRVGSDELLITLLASNQVRDEANPREITIAAPILDQLLERWHELTRDKSPEIVISRLHDADKVELFAELVEK